MIIFELCAVERKCARSFLRKGWEIRKGSGRRGGDKEVEEYKGMKERRRRKGKKAEKKGGGGKWREVENVRGGGGKSTY